MFAGDSQMLHNKRHFVMSMNTIKVFYCIPKKSIVPRPKVP